MKRILVTIGLLCVLVFTVRSARAAAIGVYGTGGVEMTNWKYQEKITGTSTDYGYGGGIIIDSNAAQDRVFGYRFTLGYEQYFFHSSYGSSMIYINDEPIHRFSMSHTFEFGIVRTPSLRFWIGPQIGFHYFNANYTKQDKSSLLMTLTAAQFGFFIPPETLEFDIDYLGLDLMLATGINYNIGKTVTLFLELGFGYVGKYNLNGPYGTGNTAGNSIGMQAKAGIMFRVNDTFAAVANDKAAM
jgi:hypothetical protein